MKSPRSLWAITASGGKGRHSAILRRPFYRMDKKLLP